MIIFGYVALNKIYLIFQRLQFNKEEVIFPLLAHPLPPRLSGREYGNKQLVVG